MYYFYDIVGKKVAKKHPQKYRCTLATILRKHAEEWHTRLIKIIEIFFKDTPQVFGKLCN
ncbi:hypothetical protein EDC47_10352 [Raoultella planticola]|nr:hypothetical protein EDC47_10352 [Raoultella planticola]